MEASIFLITCGDNLKLRRLLFGMRQLFIHGGLAAAWVLGGVLPAADGSFDLARLEREVVVAAADDPVALDFGPSGSIFFVERTGTVKKWEATTGGVRFGCTRTRVPVPCGRWTCVCVRRQLPCLP